MDLSLITARIQDQVAALAVGNRVAGAAELEAAVANPEQLIKPSAFVIWGGDEALDQNPAPGQQARFREDFAVVVAVDNSLKPRGEGAVATVESLKADLENALVGWSPSASHLPIIYTGSNHVLMDPVKLLHSFQYSTVVPGGSIFTYTFGFRVAVLPGASIPTLFALYETQVNSVIGADTRLTSDYLLDREAIPEGETRYQLRQVLAAVDDTRDTANDVEDVSVEVTVVHNFAPGEVERTYTETTMRVAQQTLLAPSFWRDQTLTKEVSEPPELSFGADLSRE